MEEMGFQLMLKGPFFISRANALTGRQQTQRVRNDVASGFVRRTSGFGRTTVGNYN